MTLETAKLLFDIETACALLRQFTQGKSFADYDSDALLRAAVEREFIIIGEALTQAVKHEPSVTQSIRHSRQIIGFRNILVHGYASILHTTVWGVVENHLVDLTQDISALIVCNSVSDERVNP